MTSTDISNAVNAVINAYPSGSRIGFSGVEVGQCPAPVCEYMVRLGMPVPFMANDRADGWGTNFPAELAPYLTHEAFEPGKQYPEGTIYMWDSPHIVFSVASSDGSNTVKVFEQNADPDGAGCQVFNRTINLPGAHTCTYVLIPRLESEPPGPTFDTEQITPKQVQLMVATAEIDLSERLNPENYPIAEQPYGYIFTAVAIYHHVNGLNYYAPDLASPGGYLYGNCADYIPPPPAPYVPPAAPVAVKLATQIRLVVTVPTYASSLDAQNGANAVGTFPAGVFYQFGTDNGMLNIGLTNQSTTTVWINPKDNVASIVPPVPEQVIEPQVASLSETAPELDPVPATPSNDAWKASYIPFHPGTSPITKADVYIVNIAGIVTDIAGLATQNGSAIEVPLVKGEHVNVYGRFIYEDETYYRLRIKRDTDFKYYLGVPVSYNGRAVLILPPTTWLERLFHKGVELKSIFEESEPKWLDSIINPYRRKK